MNEILFGYAVDLTVLILLCMLALVAVKKGLEVIYEIQTLANKIFKRVKE